jgi:tRNA-specific 2-thiouridylase
MTAQKNNGATVVVGMSGGVDSSVSAYLLKEQGYNVIGLFMKNWEETDGCGFCTAESDFNDVKRVCEVLQIPYYSVNFSREYMDKVFAHFIDGLKHGITPNPDILCNREIKFGFFLDFADKLGAQYVATGHYSRVQRGYTTAHSAKYAMREDIERLGVRLLKSADRQKDQTYFLCGLNQKQLERVIFPLGEIEKPRVREIAQKLGLVTHNKPDSTGICFIGERNFREFLREHINDAAGDIKTLDGKVVGRHTGLHKYTIGQRKGMGIGATGEHTAKWFVVRKDMAANVLYVNNGDCQELYSTELTARNFNWIAGVPPTKRDGLTAKTRYRQPDQACTIEIRADIGGKRPDCGGSGDVTVHFATPQRAVTAGQWVVLYDGDVCLGGGEIC